MQYFKDSYFNLCMASIVFLRCLEMFVMVMNELSVVLQLEDDWKNGLVGAQT